MAKLGPEPGRKNRNATALLLQGLSTPAIAQLLEHLTVDQCSDQMVPGSIPGGRTLGDALFNQLKQLAEAIHKLTTSALAQYTTTSKYCAATFKHKDLTGRMKQLQ